MARTQDSGFWILRTAGACAVMIALCLALVSLSWIDIRAYPQSRDVSGSPSPTTAITHSPTPADVSPTSTSALTITPSAIPDASATPSPTGQMVSSTPTSSLTPIPHFPPHSILINEIAWAGTRSSAYDEWIELFNPGHELIDLTGWHLEDGGDISISLDGIIGPRSLYILERSDDTTIADVRADQIYTGSLNNGGESLWLRDPTGAIIDSANALGGAWPAGDVTTRASMERLGGSDRPGNWRTWNGLYSVGHDSGGYPIAGTPRQATSLVWIEATRTPTATSTEISSIQPPTATQTAAFTPTATPTRAPSFPPFAVIINEVAWAGTLASAFDEWIELYNPGEEAIDMAGWSLEDGGDISIALTGVIAPRSHYLLERSDDTTVSMIHADHIFSGGLDNGGETLWLRDPTGAVIDTANAAGGAWPAGDAHTRASMERRGGSDRPGNWHTWMGHFSSGFDAGGNPIAGTPRQSNSFLYPTPIPTGIPGSVVINEVLIRPHYDWNGSGKADVGDEFIELFNSGPGPVNLDGWILDDVQGGGAKPYIIPSRTIHPGTRVAFFRSQTLISLNDAGDVVRLMAPDGRIIDQIRYIRVRAFNLSYGRLPDGSSNFAYALWPTPGSRNVAFVEPLLEAESSSSTARVSSAIWRHCPTKSLPWPILAGVSRHPAMWRWMVSINLFVCR